MIGRMLSNNYRLSVNLRFLLVIFISFFLIHCGSTVVRRESSIGPDYNMVWDSCYDVVKQFGIRSSEKSDRFILSKYFRSKSSSYKNRERSQILIRISPKWPYRVKVQVKVQHEVLDRNGYLVWENYGFDHQNVSRIQSQIKSKIRLHQNKFDVIRDMRVLN